MHLKYFSTSSVKIEFQKHGEINEISNITNIQFTLY